MNRLPPSSTYSSPSRRAVDRIAALSEPLPGSVSAYAASHSPDASFGRNRCFCSSVPASLIPSEPSSCEAMIRPLVAQHLRQLLDRHEGQQRARADAAVLLVEHHPEEVVLAEELHHVPRKLAARVDLGRARRNPLARERPHQPANLALLVGQRIESAHELSLDSVSVRFANVILAGGLIRTLDPQIPTQRALAIAGEHVAGGVGVHETALASPETIDLGGRVVVPGFSDAHVHFPTWALAQTEVNLDGCASLAAGRRARPGVAGCPETAAGCAGTGGGAATGPTGASRPAPTSTR